MTKGKERPGDLHKKISRLRESRDGIKQNSLQKTLMNKKLRDRNAEISASRDFWKERNRDLTRAQYELEQKLQISQKEVEYERTRADQERMRADEERDRSEKLKEEIENIRKKKSGN